MKLVWRITLLAALAAALVVASAAQQSKKTGVLDNAEVKQLVPASYFFDDQVAPVQVRNSMAVRLPSGKLVLAGFVDNSGYSSNVAQKYQGFFVTTTKITLEGKELVPGQYGFGFTDDGKFRVMDVGGEDVLLVPCHEDANLKHPVPLKATEEAGSYRFYAGKKYVSFK